MGSSEYTLFIGTIEFLSYVVIRLKSDYSVRSTQQSPTEGSTTKSEKGNTRTRQGFPLFRRPKGRGSTDCSHVSPLLTVLRHSQSSSSPCVVNERCNITDLLFLCQGQIDLLLTPYSRKIKGSFSFVLTTCEFIRDGVSISDFNDFVNLHFVRTTSLFPELCYEMVVSLLFYSPLSLKSK